MSDSEFKTTALRCTFSIEESASQSPWYADIAIWNLAGDTKADILDQCNIDGTSVQVEAGYQKGKYATIYQGKIFQPLFDRLNATDHVLTLHCIDGLDVMIGNFCSFTLSKGWNYVQLIKEMARASGITIATDERTGKEKISDKIDPNTHDRARSTATEPQYLMRDIARKNNALFWVKRSQLHVAKLEDDGDRPPVVLSSKSGLIGTPQQMTNGVQFQTLLDPDLCIDSPLRMVKIENAYIAQMKIRQGMNPSPLDKDGLYKVIRVVHRGDTRGTDWYTEVTGMNPMGNVNNMLLWYPQKGGSK